MLICYAGQDSQLRLWSSWSQNRNQSALYCGHLNGFNWRLCWSRSNCWWVSCKACFFCKFLLFISAYRLLPLNQDLVKLWVALEFCNGFWVLSTFVIYMIRNNIKLAFFYFWRVSNFSLNEIILFKDLYKGLWKGKYVMSEFLFQILGTVHNLEVKMQFWIKIEKLCHGSKTAFCTVLQNNVI